MSIRGSKLTKEHKRKISLARQGQRLSKEHREKIGLANSGKKRKKNKEWRKKLSDALLGRKHTLEHRKRISHSCKKSCQKGIAHYKWRGGNSIEGYPSGWTNILREQIRNRDNRKCQFCGCPELEDKQRLAVHHIDYNKQNLSINNLISLCSQCHKLTSEDRGYWESVFLNTVKV
jgi:5-methylcytosine-specific restriction endonuclease McrA